MKKFYDQYGASLQRSVEQTVMTTQDGAIVDAESAFTLLKEWTARVRDGGGIIHLVGNGASACMASHLAIDWTKNAGVKALAYNDVAFLTATGNDLGYEQVFAQPVAWFGGKIDLLVTISSSGNSANVLRAIEAAREKGMRVVTFSGMKPDNLSRQRGDLNFYVAAWTYGMVECSHQILLHAWLDSFMEVREWELAGPQIVTPPLR